MKQPRFYLSPLRRSLLVGVLVCLAGQFYFSLWKEGFRLSGAVILFPVLLLTLKRESHRPDTGLVTAVCVLVFRVILSVLHGLPFWNAVMREYPGALFYLCYDLMLCLMLKDRREGDLTRIWFYLFLCDFVSNILNFVCMYQSSFLLSTEAALSLLWTAFLRCSCVCAILWVIRSYRQLLLQQEHELRYRRLFLMTANLKTELYFLKKDSEDVEKVMAHAYKLYEQLEGRDVPEELKALSLSIARDVHEIKKDNLRIIRGLEQEVEEACDHENMPLRDLLSILTQSTRAILGERRADIWLDCRCENNIPIREHYRVLSILKNLVANAVEAILGAAGRGEVRVVAEVTDEKLILTVIDNGPGISPRGKRFLFKVGYSTKFDQTSGNIGRGVGLPAVQFIVDELGGSITMDSACGRGTQFRVALPLANITGDQT